VRQEQESSGRNHKFRDVFQAVLDSKQKYDDARDAKKSGVPDEKGVTATGERSQIAILKEEYERLVYGLFEKFRISSNVAPTDVVDFFAKAIEVLKRMKEEARRKNTLTGGLAHHASSLTARQAGEVAARHGNASSKERTPDDALGDAVALSLRPGLLPENIALLAQLDEGAPVSSSELIPSAQNPVPAAPMVDPKLSGGREPSDEDKTVAATTEEELLAKEQAKQPFPPAADVVPPVANKPRDEKIHTNPYGWNAAAAAAAAEEPRKTWPSPLAAPPGVTPPPGWVPSPPPPSSAGADKPKAPSEPVTPEASEVRSMPAAPDDADPADDGAVADTPTRTGVVTKAGVAKPDRPSKKGRKHRAGGE
jgi:hypothetical protein